MGTGASRDDYDGGRSQRGWTDSAEIRRREQSFSDASDDGTGVRRTHHHPGSLYGQPAVRDRSRSSSDDRGGGRRASNYSRPGGGSESSDDDRIEPSWLNAGVNWNDRYKYIQEDFILPLIKFNKIQLITGAGVPAEM